MAALTEEQALIKDQASSWAREDAPVAKFREMRDSGNPKGFDKGTWESIGSMGWAGIIIPEEFDGVDMGYLTFGIVLEELGRQLTASPLLSSGLVAASALVLGGSPEQKKAWLPQVAEGSKVMTLAVDEQHRHAPEKTALTAEKKGDGFVLNGRKVAVPEAAAADAIIVSARTSGSAGEQTGISLFLVDAKLGGIDLEALASVDHRGYANVTLSNVAVPADALIGELDQGAPLLESILDRARAGVSAEMLGTAAQSFDMTLEYLKTRVQFGNVIGSFQGLSHRASALFTEMEKTRSCVEAALQAIDADAGDVAQLCSMAKCKAGEFLYNMSNELIQIHGGIGMTDEFDAGLYLKRARALEAMYGNRAYHRDRFATLEGF